MKGHSFSLVCKGLGLALTLAASLVAAGQEPTPATPAPTTPAQVTPAPVASVPADPALWVVKGPHATVYLFGTIHVMKPEVSWHNAKLTTAMDASQTLMEEVDNVDQADATQMQTLMQKLGSDKEHPLSTKITKEDLALLDTTAKKMGIPGEAVMEPMRPWVVELLLSVVPILQAGYDPKSAVDISLAQEFRAAKKPVQGFETMEEQLHFFSDMPQADEVEALHLQLKNMDNSTKDLQEVIEAWKKGDVDSIASIENRSFEKEYPALYKRLIVQRNQAWAEKLSTLLQGEGTTFVAVGAGHLAGPDSVQKLLEAKGFKSSQL